MILKFLNNYASITEFSDINIPNFTVITGVNGSGKTHLLKGIEKGFIRIEGNPTDKIKYFDYQSFRTIKSESVPSAQTLQNAKNQAWNHYSVHKKNVINWQNRAKQIYDSVFLENKNDKTIVDHYRKSFPIGQPIWLVKKEDLPSEKIWDKVQKYRKEIKEKILRNSSCLLYTSPSPRDLSTSRMPSSA